MSGVLVTGVQSPLAMLVAGVLARQEGAPVFATDREPPQVEVPNVEFLASDMRGPQLRELLAATGARSVVHLAMLGEEQPIRALDAEARTNVLSVMELLGACSAAGVERVVLRSSTLLYGAHADNPALIPESAPLRMAGRADPFRDYLEIERFAAGQHSRGDMAIVILRCAPLAGGGIASPLTRYLELPTPPQILGFDPRIQVLHPDDAAVAFTLAALAETPSAAFNIASAPPLTLGHAIQLAGRTGAPVLGGLLDLSRHIDRRGNALGMLPFDAGFLRYSCVADTRAACETLGFDPQVSAYDALRELAPNTRGA